ncbi:MAG: exodeoxyribonuclease VII large subunit [Prevotellaceae bacterium]|jgi:exodeoxyribonuclease VII large subunit|nr:exodeoxyribonuclease VII large subunit [Prevotellaceae bacterium]
MNAISLLELNKQIKECLKHSFSGTVWLRAEISELQETYAGHCYLELIEKDAVSNSVVARLRATCWANVYRMLKPYFETSTGQRLTAGIKILVAGKVEFHEQHGISFNICDIDPTYTLGDMARRRLEILNRLREEGVMEMNRELALPELVNRIAVISSKTAAGYEDFVNQLENNQQKLRFYCKLFPAVMQGEQTERSVIEALDRIYQYHENFDVVVIIRGGGATADLASFDSYDLAYYCTQFPLPIIVGIGHQRDHTILDSVAHTSVKTPTAVAELLIENLSETAEKLEDVEQQIYHSLQLLLQTEQQRLHSAGFDILRQAEFIIERKKQDLSNLKREVPRLVRHYLDKRRYALEIRRQRVQSASPELMLKKGYSITTHNGKIVKSASQLRHSDSIVTHLFDGKVTSVIS